MQLQSAARFPFKRNRLRWQAAIHGCHCFDRAFLLVGACVCCVKFSFLAGLRLRAVYNVPLYRLQSVTSRAETDDGLLHSVNQPLQCLDSTSDLAVPSAIS